MNIGRSDNGPYYREMAITEAGTGKTVWQTDPFEVKRTKQCREE